MPAGNLCLDITEQTLRYNGDGTWTALRRLKEAGVKLGLDDFGTGARHAVAVRDLNLDILRLDRLFITDLVDERRGPGHRAPRHQPRPRARRW